MNLTENYGKFQQYQIRLGSLFLIFKNNRIGKLWI